MGLVRSTLMCVLWGCFTLFNTSAKCHNQTEVDAIKALQDEVVDPRSRHRLQLLFPLLLRISTRLATLVPTALMGLFGIILFVIFSKKAFIVSLFALFLSLSGKYKGKEDDIYIHKVNSYPDYNGEEHIYYHHREPLKFKKQYYGGNRPHKKWKKYVKRTVPSSPHLSFSDFSHSENKVQPFKPLPPDLKKGTHFEKGLRIKNPFHMSLSTNYGEENSEIAFVEMQNLDESYNFRPGYSSYK